MCIEAGEFQFIASHPLNLNIDETGFGWGLPMETPEGAGHFSDQKVLDEVGGFPGFEVNFDKFLKFGEPFSGKDEVSGVCAVGG